MNLQYSLVELGLLTTDRDAAYDNLTKLASRMLTAPVSLVSIIDRDNNRQFFKSQTGLVEPWVAQLETPLRYSFCQYVVLQNSILRVCNSEEHELVRSNLLTNEFAVGSYLGFPVHSPDGVAVGALCVISDKPRYWTQLDEELLTMVALCVDNLIKLQTVSLTYQETQRGMLDFTRALSHDMKSPMSTLQLLHEEIALSIGMGACTDQVRLLDSCRIATHRTCHIVDDAMKLTQLFGDDITGEFVDIMEIIKDVVINLSGEIEQAQARIEILGQSQAVFGNPSQLGILLAELLSNSLKFCKEGYHPHVIISVFTASDGIDTVLSIKDNGIGIAPEFHERIYKLFAQLHLRGRYLGNGVGLALCKRIAFNHSGSISVKSREGSGAEFVVTIPLKYE